MKATFPSGVYDFHVSLFQTVVLLCFNSAESLPYSQIEQTTGLEKGELGRTLQSLACGKVRLLVKTPKVRFDA